MLRTVEAQQKPLAVLNQHRREVEAVDRIDAGLERVATQVESFAESLTLGTGQGGFHSSDTPHAAEVGALQDRARAAVTEAADAVAAAAAELRETANVERQRPEREEWRTAFDRADAEYRALRDASGDDAEEQPELLRQQVDSREDEMTAVEEKLKALRTRAAERPTQLESLRAVWGLQIAARREIADALKDLVPRTATGDPYVEVEIRPFADTAPLRQKLNEWVHGQALSDAEAAEVCDRAAMDADGDNPVDVVVGWVRDLAQGSTPSVLKEIDLRPIACARLGEKITPDRVRELERLRLPDKALVRLRRHDGTLAGSLEKGLSVGQRCTAIIALALAAGREPIIIDQPEDEIDNEFIYTELVPLLRKAKYQRQVIITTHNPNLPVLGDAELIYALEARGVDGGVRGFPKRVSSDLAIGSLDRDSVKAAVEAIMEGSKEAFNRRRARYGF